MEELYNTKIDYFWGSSRGIEQFDKESITLVDIGDDDRYTLSTIFYDELRVRPIWFDRPVVDIELISSIFRAN